MHDIDMITGRHTQGGRAIHVHRHWISDSHPKTRRAEAQMIATSQKDLLQCTDHESGNNTNKMNPVETTKDVQIERDGPPSHIKFFM